MEDRGWIYAKSLKNDANSYSGRILSLGVLLRKVCLPGAERGRFEWKNHLAVDGTRTRNIANLGVSATGLTHESGGGVQALSPLALSASNVWEWTESERSDGHTGFCMVRGGSFYQARGSVWYADGGPRPCGFAAKFLLMWPGLDRCATIGFRCAADLNG